MRPISDAFYFNRLMPRRREMYRLGWGFRTTVCVVRRTYPWERKTFFILYPFDTASPLLSVAGQAFPLHPFDTAPPVRASLPNAPIHGFPSL